MKIPEKEEDESRKGPGGNHSKQNYMFLKPICYYEDITPNDLG